MSDTRARPLHVLTCLTLAGCVFPLNILLASNQQSTTTMRVILHILFFWHPYHKDELSISDSTVTCLLTSYFLPLTFTQKPVFYLSDITTCLHPPSLQCMRDVADCTHFLSPLSQNQQENPPPPKRVASFTFDSLKKDNGSLSTGYVSLTITALPTSLTSYQS